jgi:hypothetical protein
LVELEGVVGRGLFATAGLWEPLQTAQCWIEEAARVLANEEGRDAASVEAALRALRMEVVTFHDNTAVGEWATHFYKVTMNYWRGLFHCYEHPELPRTNNDLEQYFGVARHHERRATGHKRPTSAVVVRGSVRVVAAVASQVREWPAEALRLGSVVAWRRLRKDLEARHETRRAARRFRKDPANYLAKLEAQLLPQGLPL